MTLTLGVPENAGEAPEKKARKPRAAAKPKPKADAAELRRLIGRIDELASDRMPDLVDELTAEGMKFADLGPHWTASLAGVRTTATAGRSQAVHNWAAAARRELMKLEA